MKRKLKIVLFSILGLVLLLVLAAGTFIWKDRYGINFYESTPPELPADLSGKTVLLFSKTNGFRHGEAIDASIPAFEKMDFKGIVGIEYEGEIMNLQGTPDYLSNEEGIKATKRLIEKSV